MGTTVVAACWDGKELHTANVGDSRLYVVNGGIEQITETIPLCRRWSG